MNEIFERYAIVPSIFAQGVCPECGDTPTQVRDKGGHVTEGKLICKFCGYQCDTEAFTLDIPSSLSSPTVMFANLGLSGENPKHERAIAQMREYQETEDVPHMETLPNSVQELARQGRKDKFAVIAGKLWREMYSIYIDQMRKALRRNWTELIIHEELDEKFHKYLEIYRTETLDCNYTAKNAPYSGVLDFGDGIRVAVFPSKKVRGTGIGLRYAALGVDVTYDFEEKVQLILVQTDKPEEIRYLSKPRILFMLEDGNLPEISFGRAVFNSTAAVLKFGRYMELYEEAKQHCANIALNERVSLEEEQILDLPY